MRAIAREAGAADRTRRRIRPASASSANATSANSSARYLPAQPGEIRDPPDGTCVGEHPGVFFFTLGQREGLHIGGVRGREPAPWYVVGKDVDDNVLVVDQGSDSPLSAFVDAVVGSRALDRRRAAGGALRLHRADALSAARRGLHGARSPTTARWRYASPVPSARSRPGSRWCCTTATTCLGGAVIARTDARTEAMLSKESHDA